MDNGTIEKPITDIYGDTIMVEEQTPDVGNGYVVVDIRIDEETRHGPLYAAVALNADQLSQLRRALDRVAARVR